MELSSLLQRALVMNASDIHLAVGCVPLLRVNGNLARFVEGSMALTPEDTVKILEVLMPPEQQEAWKDTGETEFSYSLPGVGRFRVNAYRQRGCVSLAIRPVPYEIPSLEELNIPQAVAGLTDKKQGLILVTGPTGSGKSTTLAALLNRINQERNCYIITIEDPIEYLHQHNQSVIDQREIGGDAKSAVGALKACLRQDPDVIMVGNMEEKELIYTALNAAETGHLVLAALNTANVVQTIDWIIDAFPVYQKEQIRQKLAAVLQVVISQKLIFTAQNKELAAEILIATTAVRNLIREGKTQQLPTVMQTGGRWGMQTFDTSVNELVQQGRVNREAIHK
ncbi:MAG: PilT/PilU family type 4a pilus ATPase [Clostridia bacterium]|nr:PilT/PilU family type 4a pilus ATPase [Clostridia bacterium]